MFAQIHQRTSENMVTGLTKSTMKFKQLNSVGAFPLYLLRVDIRLASVDYVRRKQAYTERTGGHEGSSNLYELGTHLKVMIASLAYAFSTHPILLTHGEVLGHYVRKWLVIGQDIGDDESSEGIIAKFWITRWT
ncbi:hypothetical protein T265_03556 [Opisthorchis viverrini]|uniref:Uncharacterized protein n=1 Tax=Opisthorchis viverrini TaxID=6198 RepID=A0A074ZRW5_OPIVI|nr:hypothetical protein T265_03556 [Opisthorchis viverrini]KER29856.1 hypothetical protein T265_03556 [Opisthorchis viverrini]